jgi:hypothetical protein
MLRMHLADVSVIISLGALGVAIYGIFERGRAAGRAERIRLTSIVDDLARSRADFVDRQLSGELNPSVVEAYHARTGVLSQQAFSLIRGHALAVTSAECREVAYHLEDNGFDSDADSAWQLAQAQAELEGTMQVLYASRGYAYFLFRKDRPDEARELLQKALSEYPEANDRDRISRAETLNTWAGYERGLDGPLAPRAVDLNRQISALAGACVSPFSKDQLRQMGITPVSSLTVHIGPGRDVPETATASDDQGQGQPESAG